MSIRREEGVAGPFEDLPVLIVVTIAVGLFLFSLVHAYALYLEQLENSRMHEDAQGLSESLRSYNGLTDGYREGVFLGEKVHTLSNETLQEDYSPKRLGYEYQIAVIDTSDYQDSLDYTRSVKTSDVPAGGSTCSVTSSILIKVGDEYHGGQLVVTIWS